MNKDVSVQERRARPASKDFLTDKYTTKNIPDYHYLHTT